jgi:hypothetical protein
MEFCTEVMPLTVTSITPKWHTFKFLSDATFELIGGFGYFVWR